MKKRMILLSTVIIIALLIAGCGEQLQRQFKSVTSDLTGGLDRVATLYTEDGQIIKTWEGRFDVQESTISRKVLFDVNGKRTIIHGGIVVIEEK